MTVQTNTNVASFNGNGVTQIFPIAFKFNNDTDLIVLLVDDATGAVSQLTLNSDYTVSGEGDEEGGLINVVIAPATGKRLKVTRLVDILQLTDLRNQGKFFAEVHEDAFDLLTMIAQQHDSGIRSALRVAESDPEPARIPAVAQRAGKVLSFDNDGNPQVVAPVSDSSTELRLELANGTPFLVDNAIVGRSLRLVNSFADLRTVAPRHSNDQVLLLSHTVDGFGGGQFRWDASSLAADDNGTVATVSGQSGAWVRVLTRDGVRPEWWGAVPDSGQDDSAPLQTAINFAASVSGTQLGARVVLSAGQYSYTKSLVVQHESGFCPEIVGQGAFKTALHKTTTALPDDSGSHVVDAYLTFINRGASLYNYKANLRGFRCTSPAGVRHKYGIFAEKISSSQFEDIDIYSVEDGYYTADAWMMNYKAVRIHDCYRGFVWNGGGTSNLLQNCWVEYARDTAYDIYGLTYSTFIGCGADHVYDSADLTANKIAYKQSITWCLTFIGCGAEDVRGSIFYGSNAVFRVEGFRMYGIKYSSATQKLLELLGSKCSFDSCHFAHYDGSVTAANKLAITAVSQNSTNNVSFSNCRWELTNVGVPADSYGNERALASNLPLDVEGLRTARLAMSDATWRPLCKLKANCRIQFLAIVADGADRYVAPTGLYGPSVSTNPASPTALGNILNGAGTVIMAMQAYIGADNTLYLKNAATGEGRTFCFTFVTPQHW